MYSGEHAVKKKGFLRSALSLLVTVVLIVCAAWALRTFVFQAYEIPSGSMEDTISTLPMDTMANTAPPFTSHLKIPMEFSIT